MPIIYMLLKSILKNLKLIGKLFLLLRKSGIGVNVHYIPVHLHPYYKEKLKTKIGMLPNAELAYEQILSLPIFPDMKNIEMSM